ncbi:MAG: ABC transporter ATP-binding protein/permease [Alicyclobacillus sp.]|nr:ABC transporter ATP-binding protein/permease [Alicyclobacillus sp.]
MWLPRPARSRLITRFRSAEGGPEVAIEQAVDQGGEQRLRAAELRAPFVYREDEALERPFRLRQMLRLMRYVTLYPRWVAASLAATLGGVAVALVAPYLIGRTIDHAIARHQLGSLALDAAILTALYAGNLFASRARIRYTNRLGQGVIRHLRESLFRHVQGLSFDFFDQRPAGSVLVRIMNDVNSLQDLFTNGVVNSITNVFTLVGIIAIMLSLNVRLALVSMLVVPVMFILSTQLRVRIRRAWQLVRVRLSRINAHLNESIQGVRVTQAYVRQEENQSFFTEMNADYLRMFRRAVGLGSVFGPMVDVTGAVGSALLFGYGVHLMRSGTPGVTVGLLVAFANYLGNFWTPISQLGNLYNQLLVAMASSERIFQYLDTPPGVSNASGARALPPIAGEVRFEQVSFEYNGRAKALNGVTFTALPGQTIALVGHTGAGKTTVVNLLARFYEVSSGRILVDGHDIRQVTLESLRAQIGIVLQDTFIFSGTIMDNIRYGRPDATDQEVMAAARAVCADEFIQRLEKGYQTEVRERGSRLSMGQRQLISFARAILADPRILILDEATASIDTHTERLIQQGLRRLLANRTSFVIAHRLSTIREADQILVLDGGRIIEQGRHHDLMERRGVYRDLIEAQYRFML